jgi:hypothetical protein
MNIDKMIKKVLLEQETAVRGLNAKDQMDILEKGRLNCPTFKSEVGDRKIKSLDKSDIVKFPELGSVESASYISTPPDKTGAIKMFFAIENKSLKNNKKNYLVYYVAPGKPPKKYTNGWDYECDFMQQTSELGKDTMSDEQRKTLQSFLNSNKGDYYEFVDEANQGEFVKVPYSELTWPTTGRKVLPDYKGSGYIWRHSNLENENKNLNDQMTSVLTAQKFTRVQPEDASSPEANAGFFLKDIAKDYPALANMAKTSPNTKVWPMDGTLAVPSRGTCRTAIKLLHSCSKSSSPIKPAECTKDLWKNKILALQCGDRNFIGGALGIGDEFDQLLIDNDRFGLANLKKALQTGFDRSSDQPQGTNLNIKENVKNVVSKFLNEEYKRRNFRS